MRHTFAFRIKQDRKADFRQALKGACPDIVLGLKSIKAYNYSLWEAGDYCLGYYETPSDGEETDEKAVREAEERFAKCRAQSASSMAKQQNPALQDEASDFATILAQSSNHDQQTVMKDQLTSDMFAELSDSIEWLSRPEEAMRLMYHDIGYVRKEKTLIRHRVFMTELKGDVQEEYKRRHDGLVEARGTYRDPGPDSNFTIWNTGRYIFGYDEIDTSMEHPETPEEHEGTIAWESRMLEIMTWITDDVDWLSGETHPHVVRLMHWN